MTPAQPVAGILVALEATPAVVAEAGHRSAQLLLTHHPLLYRPLEDVREDRPGGQLLAALLRARLAMGSCDTNLDIAPGGTQRSSGPEIGTDRGGGPHPHHPGPLVQVGGVRPDGLRGPVRQALGDAGLGVIGRYSHCSFTSPGQGTYRPLPGAQPFRGGEGKLWGLRSPAWKSWPPSLCCPWP